MRSRVGYLASLSGLSIRSCHELWYRSQTQRGSGVAMAVAYRPATVALIQLLAWEHPCATGAAPKRWEKKKRTYVFRVHTGRGKWIQGKTFSNWQLRALLLPKQCFLYFYLLQKQYMITIENTYAKLKNQISTISPPPKTTINILGCLHLSRSFSMHLYMIMLYLE